MSLRSRKMRRVLRIDFHRCLVCSWREAVWVVPKFAWWWPALTSWLVRRYSAWWKTNCERRIRRKREKNRCVSEWYVSMWCERVNRSTYVHIMRTSRRPRPSSTGVLAYVVVFHQLYSAKRQRRKCSVISFVRFWSSFPPLALHHSVPPPCLRRRSRCCWRLRSLFGRGWRRTSWTGEVKGREGGGVNTTATVNTRAWSFYMIWYVM